MTTHFKQSTQYNHWFFHENESKLREIREEISNNIRQTIVNKVNNNNNTAVADGASSVVNPEVDCLNANEEIVTIQKNIAIMSALCERFKFHIHVEGTAMIYFKRFLLYHSIMQFDINILMLTCIFLAAKTEENHIKLDDFLHRINEFTQSNIDKKEIMKTELILLQGLQFHLIVYHPYRSLYAFVHDFFEAERQNETAKLFENAKKFIKESYKTDVSFIYPPGTIALAALFHFNPTDTEHFIEKNYASKDIDVEHLMQSIKNIDSIVTRLSTDKQQAEQDKLTLKSATKKFKKIKKIITQYKIFDTEELERQQEEENMRRRAAKLKEREEKERQEIEQLLLR